MNNEKVGYKMKDMKKNLVYIAGVVLIIAAFFGGMFYGKSSDNPAASKSGASGRFIRGFNGQSAGSINIITGKVIAKDQQSLTISLPNGNSEIVFYSTSTPVEKPSPVSINSVSTGSNVVVSGTQNSDGSFTADSIQVRGANQGPGPSFGQ